MLISRLQLQTLQNLANSFPVIGIIGPRQVGKTTLAKEFSKLISKETVYLDLERPSDIDKLKEPELFLGELTDKCVMLDEVQRLPEIFPLLRSLVDEHRVPLRFVLLGSASPDLLRNTSETLAGRIAYAELGGFNFLEIKENLSLKEHHFKGGFPEAALSPDIETTKLWLDNFIITYLERDLPLLGLTASPVVTRRLLEMLAWQNGRILNYSTLSKSLGFSNQTANRYIDFLEGAFLITRLQPFYFNIKKRLVKSPKILMRDTGMLHRLLRLESFEQLMGNPLLGASWEAYVIEQIRGLKSNDIDLYFYRTHAGAEVDLVLAKSLKAVSSIEIKFTSTPNMSKGMHQCIADLETGKNFIITPKSDDYPIRENVRACNIERFLTKYLQEF
jgi:predicted AAA+ superfamily ATPase